MTLLAVDPGKNAGWAIVDARGVVSCGTCDGSDQAEVKMLVYGSANDGVDTLVIEDQYPGRCGWKAIKTLLYRCHLWIVYARDCGLNVVAVNPASWQAHYNIKRGDKDAIVSRASMLAIGANVRPNSADAVCIGVYYYDIKIYGSAEKRDKKEVKNGTIRRKKGNCRTGDLMRAENQEEGKVHTRNAGKNNQTPRNV